MWFCIVKKNVFKQTKNSFALICLYLSVRAEILYGNIPNSLWSHSQQRLTNLGNMTVLPVDRKL